MSRTMCATASVASTLTSLASRAFCSMRPDRLITLARPVSASTTMLEATRASIRVWPRRLLRGDESLDIVGFPRRGGRLLPVQVDHHPGDVGVRRRVRGDRGGRGPQGGEVVRCFEMVRRGGGAGLDDAGVLHFGIAEPAEPDRAELVDL